MACTENKFFRRLSSLTVILFFIFNIIGQNYAFADSGRMADISKPDTLEATRTPDAGYSAADLIQRELINSGIVKVHNGILNDLDNKTAINKADPDTESRRLPIEAQRINSGLLPEFPGQDYRKIDGGNGKENPANDNGKNDSPGTKLDLPIPEGYEIVGYVGDRPIIRQTVNGPDHSRTTDDVISDLEERLGRPLTDEEKEYIVSINRDIKELALSLLDANNDGRADEEYGSCNNFSMDYGNISDNGGVFDNLNLGLLLTPDTMKSLYQIFAKTVWGSDNSAYDFNGIKVNLVHGKDGPIVTITTKDWTITMAHYSPPRGITGGGPRIVSVTFENLQRTKERISREMDAAESSVVPASVYSCGDNASGFISTGGSVATGNIGGVKIASPDTGRKRPFGKKAATIPGRGRTAKRNIGQISASSIAKDGYKLLREDWHSEKTLLDKVIERIIKEDAGAVYTNSGGVIEAIILLKAKGTKSSKDDKDDKDNNDRSV